jgi:hypothetical protein
VRRRYVYDPISKEMVEIGKAPPSEGLFVMGDIKPYVAVAGDMAGKEISSRSQHRAFLKRNGFDEVGNEKKAFFSQRERFIKETEKRAEAQRSEAIKRALDDYRIRD